MESLFGGEFEIKLKQPKVKNLLDKINGEEDEDDTLKQLSSKKLSLQERLDIIRTKVLTVLGKQRKNVIVIKNNADFEHYVDLALASGRIAIDTETNNSLDPVTCQLMGLCLYYPGGKQAYIPVNHINNATGQRLAWQLTEADCKRQLERINNSGILRIMHNGKFDYEVLKCTCHVEVKPDWDTMVCARLLDENELAGLKYQYTTKIDKKQEKYDIEKLFANVMYAQVDPEIFALYAATDPMMTDKLYEYQAKELEKPEYGPHMDLRNANEIKGLRWLFHNVEMPIVIVTAEMELKGVCIDMELGQRLADKYNGQLADIDSKIAAVLKNVEPFISEWKQTKEANAPTKEYATKKSKMSAEKLEQKFPLVEKSTGRRYKVGKSKAAQLGDKDINLASPVQLAILFYDILGVDPAKDGATSTGKDDMKRIKETLAAYLPKLEELEIDEDDLEEEAEESVELSDDDKKNIKLGSAAKLADLILTRRGIAKLLTTYIDVIPALSKHWPDGRIRFHLNSLGTDTGRYSSGGKLKFMEGDKPITVSGINIQNIPSHNPEIRMLFKAQPGYKIVGSDYSAQEPRMTTFLSGDANMNKAYNEGKDLYAMIAQSAYHNNYEDNLEFWPEGTKLEIDGKEVIAGHKTNLNKDGKARRAVGKVLNLAATYGMSGATAGARLGYTGKEAKEKGTELLTNFFTGFGGVKTAIDQSQAFLVKHGYVEDFLGRRRRLNDIYLPKYEIRYADKTKMEEATFNPIIGCKNRIDANGPIAVWQQIIDMYLIYSQLYQLKKSDEKDKNGRTKRLPKGEWNTSFVINDEMAKKTFEDFKRIAADPSCLNTNWYDFKGIVNDKPNKYSTTSTLTVKQKLNRDYAEFMDVLTHDSYNDDIIPDYECFKPLFAQLDAYKAKYGMTTPKDIPNEKMQLLTWTGKIAQAKRQCFNARIQGSAASLTKMAMIDIFNDELLNKWDAHLIITVHDEVLVECPEEYADLVEQRLPEIMVNAAKKGGDNVPQSCDPYNVSRWYCDTAAATILDELKKLEAKGVLHDEAINKVIANHSEVPTFAIMKTIETGCDLEF